MNFAMDETIVAGGGELMSTGQVNSVVVTDQLREQKSITGDGQDLWTNRDIVRSRTLDELQSHPVFGNVWGLPPSVDAAEESPLAKASRQRVAMLAKKFEGTVPSREDTARIAILTERIHRLSPRVSTLSWTKAEEMINHLEVIGGNIESIVDQYGL